MSFRWSMPGFPHKGYQCIDVIDLRPPDAEGDPSDYYDICDMCFQERIRYVHVMQHPELDNPLRVGCVCADKMAEGYEGKRPERELRNRANRRKSWLERSWTYSKKGNPYRKGDSYFAVLFPDAYRPGEWRYKLNGEYSRESYPSYTDTKMALFKELIRTGHL